MGQPVGLYRHTRPHIIEMPVTPNTVVVVYTDGVPATGVRRGQAIDVRAEVERLHAAGLETAQRWADQLLAAVTALDEGQPSDDASLLVVAVLRRQSEDDVRRMLVRMPL